MIDSKDSFTQFDGDQMIEDITVLRLVISQSGINPLIYGDVLN
jgi:hypothetical protein